MKITVIGSGYVGTTTAVVLASLNHQVIAADIDTSKVQKLQQGRLHFFEPGLETMLNEMLNKKRLQFTSDLHDAIQKSDILYISVGTPPRLDGTADLTFLQSVADTIAEAINGYKVIVTKSTVPIGTNRWLHQYLTQKTGSAKQFDIISNPEFLREGAALYDTLHPDRTVIGGTDADAINIVKTVYQDVDSNFVITDWESAELIKYASNSFLATKISFINEIARIADRAGADIRKVVNGMGMDKRIGQHNLQAGIGYGGSCFPKDVKALIATARELNVSSKILEAVEHINQTQPEQYVQKLADALNGTVQQPWTLAVLGLTFKPDTDDLRESPAIRLINSVMGFCKEIRILDPTVKSRSQTPWPDEQIIKVAGTVEEVLFKADAAVLCTDWPLFANINWKEAIPLMQSPTLIDGRNMYDSQKLKSIGIRYFALGRGERQ